MALTKNDLVKLLYDRLDVPKPESLQIVDSVLDIIRSELVNGNEVLISGFGKWVVKEKRARNGRNPQTGQPVIIAARKVVTFKPSSIMRKKENDSSDIDV